MKLTLSLFAVSLLLMSSGLAARQEKTLVCHVGSQAGPGGEVFLDDPDCVPSEENSYFCPDAGKIDLIVVGNADAHLGNPSHSWDGLADYEPAEVGASGDGTEDSDGDGVDDGCEPAMPCPCWAEDDLLSVTADNQSLDGSCSDGSVLPLQAVIQNDEVDPEVEGGFSASSGTPSFCSTRDFEPFFLLVTFEEATACISQIATRCAAIGDPIPSP
jgi:hypothetical protein